MRYEIKGDTLPVVICYLDGGEIERRVAVSTSGPGFRA